MVKSWRSNTSQSEPVDNVIVGLQRCYREKLQPVESDSQFHYFHSPEMTDADFASQPMVLLVGQYSTGKTTLINHLLGRDYPGTRIGPEPTTDKFVAVVNNQDDQKIPGNVAVSDPSLPFTQLSLFGSAFLERFECAKLPSSVLEGITLIDSPGVLAGEKQRLSRGYEFEAVIKWFADRVDTIILLFDVSKLDISDEFRRVILALKGNDQKVHIILNKADSLSTTQLMRVYGSLMWYLGKVMDTPEVARVYIGSFWDEPYQNDEQKKLFESQESDLYTHLSQMPRNAAVRKLDDLIKRARLAKVHAYLIDHLKTNLPWVGKEKAKQSMITDLPNIYEKIANERNLTLGDFPDVTLMQEKLQTMDFTKFKQFDKRKMDALDQMLSEDVEKLMKMIPQEAAQTEDADLTDILHRLEDDQSQWLSAPDPEQYRNDFMAIGPDASGRITAQQAKPKMLASKLPSHVLHAVWSLADLNTNGLLTLYEYALAMHFIKMRLDGQDLPRSVPPQMMPSSDA